MGQTQVPRKAGHWCAFFLCNGCHGPLSVAFQFAISTADPQRQMGDLRQVAHSLIFFPNAAQSFIPQHLPGGVARAFEQADVSILQNSWDAAGAMDRRALELATADKAPEQRDQTLYKRIEFLANEGRITPSLKDWAHNLRVVGNNAVHDEDGLTEDDARQAHELTRFILTYLYTLPEQVRLAQELREQG